MNFKTCVTLLFFFSLHTMIGQFAYFYVASDHTRYMNKNEITIYNGKEQPKVMTKQWERIDLVAGKKYELTVKSTFYKKSKKIKIDLTKNKAVFIGIKLFDDSWQMVEEPKEKVESMALYDYRKIEEKRQLQDRTKKHPNSGWTEKKLKQRFNEETTGVEGIYEALLYQSRTAHVLAIIKESDDYKVIFLSRGGNNDVLRDDKVWKEGDLKALLIRTASPTVFKAKWYKEDKTINPNCYFEFEEYSLRVLKDNEVIGYQKMYPTSKN